MYKVKDYLYNGLLFMNNMLRPHNKKLSQLMIYATTQCQSRCKHCSIWKKPEEHLSFEDVKAILRSRCVTKNTVIGLEGGEFLLHPEADTIMEWLKENHPCYTLLSNCLAPKKVIHAVRAYQPRHLYVSLDGNKETYQYMRGCNGYDKVIEVVETLKDEVPISLMFCLSPWNTFKDMEFVINVAKMYGIDVRIGIYGTMDFFDTTADLLAVDIENYLDLIPANIHDTDENYDFVALYNEWRNGHLHLRCHSIFSELVIHSNGNVPLCQNLNVMLGNIHEQSLDEIFNARQSVKIQCRYSRQCNKCWINFHRKYDIILIRNFERLLPKRLIEMFYGEYSLTKNRNITYMRYFKRLANTTKVYNYSDARAKENVQSLTTGLNTILQLRPVTYNWKISSSKDVATTSTTTSVANGPAEDDQQQYGFLAQEVESVLPDAVKTDEEGHKMINYIAIIPMLVQAVQELQATVETQANMLSMIKNQGDIDAVNRLSKNRIVSCTPNPTSGNVEIKTEIDGEAKMPTLLISTLTGTREATLSVNSASVTYNASNLKAGIYIVSLYVDGKLVDSTRLIKE